MFIYTKPEGKGKWKLIENKPEAVPADAFFKTVLSVDQDVSRLEEGEKIFYKGPLYFDIDAEDENDSLDDCRRLLLSLYADYGVNLNDLLIHCTGGKGFHILVPAKVFSSGKATQHLAYTYKQVAVEFNLAYLDYGIYSGGKGRMWRIENIQRASGRYKVALTAAEIFGLDFKAIFNRTLVPGPPTELKKKVSFSAELSALFRRSTYKPRKIITIADEKLKQLPDDPDCIKNVLAVKDIKAGRRFNHLTLLLSSYGKGRGWSFEELTEKAQEFLETYPSSVYKTHKDKIQHLKSIFNYVNSSGQYDFNCSASRLNVECQCADCPIEQDQIEKDYDTSLGLELAHNCYFRKTETGRVQITTFAIVPRSIVEYIDPLTESEFTINVSLISDNGRSANVVFTQPDWASKSALIKRLPHPDFAYFGGDVEVQKLFKLAAQVEVPQKTGVKVIGLHKVGGKWHFVSKEGSIGPNGEENELLLETDYYLPMKLIHNQRPSQGELDHIFSALFKFNTPQITTSLVGWFAATFFKERIFEFTRQFPLLFIFGAAGAGKTQSILNLKRLYGLEMDNIKSIADVTSFTLIKSANANNTVPLMLDEYKASMFNHFQVKMVSKLIRAAYNNEVGERGTASQKINTYFYRAPIILAGEQTVTEPAARDRIIEVHLNKSTSAPYLEGFKALQSAPLEKLGSLLLKEALAIRDDELKTILDMSERLVPDVFIDRPRLNQTIVIAGLKLLGKACSKYGPIPQIEQAIQEHIRKTVELTAEDRAEARKTDVDKILEGIDLMIEADERYAITYGYEFERKEGKLFLNLKLIYMKFSKFAAEYNVEADTMNYTSLIKLLRKESYFEQDSYIWKFKSSGKKLCCILSMDELQARGLSLPNLLPEEKEEEEKLKL